MKHHYGEQFVDRIANKKKSCKTKEERKEIQKLIKAGRRMERRTKKQALKDLVAKDEDDLIEFE